MKDLLITTIEKDFPGTRSTAVFLIFFFFSPSPPLSLPFVVNSSFLCKLMFCGFVFGKGDCFVPFEWV